MVTTIYNLILWKKNIFFLEILIFLFYYGTNSKIPINYIFHSSIHFRMSIPTFKSTTPFIWTKYQMPISNCWSTTHLKNTLTWKKNYIKLQKQLRPRLASKRINIIYNNQALSQNCLKHMQYTHEFRLIHLILIRSRYRKHLDKSRKLPSVYLITLFAWRLQYGFRLQCSKSVLQTPVL